MADCSDDFIDNSIACMNFSSSYKCYLSTGDILTHQYFTLHYSTLLYSSTLNTHSGPIIELGAWLEEQRKALRARTLDRAKSDRFDTLMEVGKLNWRFNGFTIAHPDSGTGTGTATDPPSASYLSASTYTSSSSSNCPIAPSPSSSSTSAATEMRGSWILAFEALVGPFSWMINFFNSYFELLFNFQLANSPSQRLILIDFKCFKSFFLPIFVSLSFFLSFVLSFFFSFILHSLRAYLFSL